jgi:hypothetical protein
VIAQDTSLPSGVPGAAGSAIADEAQADRSADATQAFVEAAASETAPARKPSVRIRKASTPEGDDAPM